MMGGTKEDMQGVPKRSKIGGWQMKSLTVIALCIACMAIGCLRFPYPGERYLGLIDITKEGSNLVAEFACPENPSGFTIAFDYPEESNDLYAWESFEWALILKFTVTRLPEGDVVAEQVVDKQDMIPVNWHDPRPSFLLRNEKHFGLVEGQDYAIEVEVVTPTDKAIGGELFLQWVAYD